MKKGASLLLVEDEIITALYLQEELKNQGVAFVDIAVSGQEAVHKAKTNEPAIIIMDINLIGNMDGIDAITQIQKTASPTVIYMSGYSNDDIRARALQTNPLAYIEKPVDISDILKLINCKVST